MNAPHIAPSEPPAPELAQVDRLVADLALIDNANYISINTTPYGRVYVSVGFDTAELAARFATAVGLGALSERSAEFSPGVRTSWLTVRGTIGVREITVTGPIMTAVAA